MVSILFLASFTQPTSFSVFQSPLLGSLPHLAFQLVGFGFARVVGSTTVFTSAMLCPYVRFRTLQTTRGGLALGLAIGYHHLSVCRLITIRSVPLERFHFTTSISIAASTNDSTSVSAPGIGISTVAKCFHTSCASVPSWVDAVRLATCANDSPSPGSRQGLFCLLPFQQVSSIQLPTIPSVSWCIYLTISVCCTSSRFLNFQHWLHSDSDLTMVPEASFYGPPFESCHAAIPIWGIPNIHFIHRRRLLVCW